MSIDFILGIVQASVIAIALPIVTASLFYVIIPRLKKSTGSTIRRYLSYLITPPYFESNKTSSLKYVIETKKSASWRKDKIRLYFYYLGFALFLSSFMIGEFYEVMIDLLLPVSQGSTGEMRNVTSLIFLSPFNVAWIGTLPWMGVVTYHETWSWIFFTAAFTDNPYFLSTIIGFMTLISIGVGLVFLAPLAIKRIRQAFLSSMFFFMTGMSIFTKAAISWFSYAIALYFGNLELEYVTLTANGSMIPDLSSVIVIGFAIVLVMFGLFIMLGRKLWQQHYTDAKSRKWFTAYITLSFWLVFGITILVV
ncbi:MAG: hypothetical protein AM325_014960 [Candidatus Thorarchaeota archaeon SMTZ1-45]|nr:MAG: hypothetical protein AM325_16335 [Candidatus Thorarchaeota archaeon SMTZ1-45]